MGVNSQISAHNDQLTVRSVREAVRSLSRGRSQEGGARAVLHA